MEHKNFDDPNYIRKVQEKCISQGYNSEACETLEEHESYKKATFAQRKEIKKKHKKEKEHAILMGEHDERKKSAKTNLVYRLVGAKIEFWLPDNPSRTISYSGYGALYIKEVMERSPVSLKKLQKVSGKLRDGSNVSTTIRKINIKFRKSGISMDKLIDNPEGRNGYSINGACMRFIASDS